MSKKPFDIATLFPPGQVGTWIDVSHPEGLFTDEKGHLWARNLATGEDRGMRLKYGIGTDPNCRKCAVISSPDHG